eukprot:4868660-Alexandrium_andersonii.AAC.1
MSASLVGSEMCIRDSSLSLSLVLVPMGVRQHFNPGPSLQILPMASWPGREVRRVFVVPTK